MPRSAKTPLGLIGGILLTFSTLAAPRLGVIPEPRRVELGAPAFVVSEKTPIVIASRPGPEAVAADELILSLRDDANLTLVITEQLGDEAPASAILIGDPTKDARVAKRLEALGLKLTEEMAEEGYVLGVDSSGVVIGAKSAKGLLYGAMTLRQMVILAGGKPLPAVRVHDWPAMKIRGIHDEISYGQVSTMANFKDMLRFCARHKLNTFMIYLEDMYRFSKYPTIGLGRGALTREQVDELEAFAKPLGVEIIPVFETLGNQGALLMLDAVRPLAEYPGAHSFGIDDGTYTFMADCLDELCAAFDSKYFNAGLDESWDLGFGKTRDRVKKEGRGPVHADHYRKINEMLKARGKTMMMYADIILNRPEILSLIPKDIILVDWHYEPQQHYPSVPKLAGAGFPLIVLPGMNNWDRIFPMMSGAMINIENFTADAHRVNALGSITSTWGDNGSKNLRELLYYGYAYTGQVTWSPEKNDLGAFSESYFTIFNGPGTAGGIQAIYALIEKWPWWYPLLDYFRDPFLPRKDERKPAEQALYRVEQDARVARELVAGLRPRAIRRPGDLDYLDYCAAMHVHYVQQQRLVRDLTDFDAGKPTPEAKQAAKAGFLARAVAMRTETESLRDRYKELWLRTNLPANLHYGIDEYDSLAKVWRDAEERIAHGVFAHDPRPAEAKWVYHPAGFDKAAKVHTAYFRKTIDANPESLERAHIQVQGDTHVFIHVNGKLIGEQFARRNLSAPVNPQLVKVYDIKPHLVAGQNVIAVEARDYGTENFELEPGGPRECGGFILYGELKEKNQPAKPFGSDESWKVTDASPSSDWTKVGFADASWPAARPDTRPTVWLTRADFTENWPGYSARR